MDASARGVGLQRLGVLVGTWELEAAFPSDPPGRLGGIRSECKWMSGGQLLVQRTEIPGPEAPDSLLIYDFDPEDDTFTQHYFDSRGVVRLYKMSLRDGEWNLWRDSPDFSPLEFSQRFIATIADDGNTINGAWEIAHDHTTWEHDFNLTYKKVA